MANADDSDTTRDAAMDWYKVMQKLDDVRQRYYEICPGQPKVRYGHLHGQPIMISDTSAASDQPKKNVSGEEVGLSRKADCRMAVRSATPAIAAIVAGP